MADRVFNVLFLCTGNAARSQMAEAIARAFHGETLDVVSAGSRPAGWVHPLAVEAMSQLGVDMSEPNTPPLEMVNVPPVMSAMVSCPALARLPKSAIVFSISAKLSLSAFRMTGTTKPLGADTATDTSA